jgi:hypothetical protein
MTLGALVLAALAGTIDVSDRSEFRLRLPGLSVTGAVVPGEGSLDLETDPDLRLTLSSRTTTYVLEYAPQIVAFDMNLGLQSTFMNTGTARAEWRGRRLRFSLAETATYGLRNFASLTVPSGTSTQTGTSPGGMSQGGMSPGGTSGVGAVPASTTSTIWYESSNTLASAGLSLRLWTLAATGGYQLSGGATPAARAAIPSQSGPLANASADYALARTDHLTTFATASASTTTILSTLLAPSASSKTVQAPSGFVNIDTALAEVDEAWQHAWSRATTTLLRAGASGGQTNGPYSTAGLDVDPVGEARVTQAFRGRNQIANVTLDASVRPTINPLLGNIDERVQASVIADYLYGRVELAAQVTASESVPPSSPLGLRIFYTQVVSSFRLSRAILLELGSRAFWQVPTGTPNALPAPAGQVTAPPLVLAAFKQEVGFVALTVRLDPVRF